MWRKEEKERGKSAGEAENRNLCRTKFPLMRDLLYGNVQLLNTIEYFRIIVT